MYLYTGSSILKIDSAEALISKPMRASFFKKPFKEIYVNEKKYMIATETFEKYFSLSEVSNDRFVDVHKYELPNATPVIILNIIKELHSDMTIGYFKKVDGVEYDCCVTFIDMYLIPRDDFYGIDKIVNMRKFIDKIPEFFSRPRTSVEKEVYVAIMEAAVKYLRSFGDPYDDVMYEHYDDRMDPISKHNGILLCFCYGTKSVRQALFFIDHTCENFYEEIFKSLNIREIDKHILGLYDEKFSVPPKFIKRKLTKKN